MKMQTKKRNLGVWLFTSNNKRFVYIFQKLNKYLLSLMNFIVMSFLPFVYVIKKQSSATKKKKEEEEEEEEEEEPQKMNCRTSYQLRGWRNKDG